MDGLSPFRRGRNGGSQRLLLVHDLTVSKWHSQNLNSDMNECLSVMPHTYLQAEVLKAGGRDHVSFMVLTC